LINLLAPNVPAKNFPSSLGFRDICLYLHGNSAIFPFYLRRISTDSMGFPSFPYPCLTLSTGLDLIPASQSILYDINGG